MTIIQKEKEHKAQVEAQMMAVQQQLTGVQNEFESQKKSSQQ